MSRHQTFDALNRLKTNQRTRPDLVTITYDAHDRPLTVKDGKSNMTTYVYDGFGERSSRSAPTAAQPCSGSTRTATSRKTDRPSSHERHLRRARPPADPHLSGGFHAQRLASPTTRPATAGHRPSDQPHRPGGLLKPVLRAARPCHLATPAPSAATTYTTGYSYESAGRLASITYAVPAGTAIHPRQRGPDHEHDRQAAGHAAVNLATSITHMPFGPVASFTYGNGVTDARTYDLDYRMTCVKDVGTGNIQYLTYGYDADNNVHTITDNVTTGEQPDAHLRRHRPPENRDRQLRHDRHHHLRFELEPPDLRRDELHDALDLQQNERGGRQRITYSSTGNMAAIGTTTTMSPRTRPTSWRRVDLSGTDQHYTYDAFGQRLKVKIGAGTPRSMYSTARPASILDRSQDHRQRDRLRLARRLPHRHDPARRRDGQRHPHRPSRHAAEGDECQQDRRLGLADEPQWRRQRQPRDRAGQSALAGSARRFDGVF